MAANTSKNVDSDIALSKESKSTKSNASTYSIDELCKARNKVFKGKVSEDLIRTALQVGKKKMYPLDEARKIVNEFKKREAR